MTDPGPTIGLVLDCEDPARLADFWAAALGYVSLGEADPSAAFAPIQRLVRSFPAVAAADPAELAAIAFVGEIAGAIAADREITRVEQVAERFGLGVRKLQRLFDDRVGASPKEFVEAWQFGNTARMVKLSSPAVVNKVPDNPPTSVTYLPLDCCGGGLAQVRVKIGNPTAVFDVGTTLLGEPNAILDYAVEFGISN